ncbi:MAG: uroporphyrinogen decarboxylase [Rhodoblastus sp.]|nr:uroporphyrinogen decarboxylase [Rhodoblastus sp.]
MNPGAQPRTRKKMLATLDGEVFAKPPMWLMRQAGRYLPEYREVRGQAGSFLDLCFNPKLAAEVTLQPIRRFGFDAAILFSDILVVPHALGQKVSFEEGYGPRLEPILNEKTVAQFRTFDIERLSSVLEAVSLVKAALPSETTFIGFCGSPWTVASYMIAGAGSKDLAAVRTFAFRHPNAFAGLIETLVAASVEYLVAQARAGVEVVQIFDSWAGLLPVDQFVAWCVEPTARIVRELRAQAPGLKIICFPREAGSKLKSFVAGVDADCLALGTAEDVRVVRSQLGSNVTLQGNLDPLALVAGGVALEDSVRRVRGAFEGAPYIFNLGHGILPETPIAHVERLIELVRAD